MIRSFWCAKTPSERFIDQPFLVCLSHSAHPFWSVVTRNTNHQSDVILISTILVFARLPKWAVHKSELLSEN